MRDPVYGAEFVKLEWRGGGERRAEIVSRIATRDRAVDIHAGGGKVAPLSGDERLLFTRATALIPADGMVKQTSDRIVAGAGSDLEKAQAIYAWLVANTQRIASTRGCGSGDVRAMLAGAPLGGKCADINGLFVGLARAAELPARDLYGLRVASSRFGCKSLGAGSADVTKAQHCRADVWLEELGWTRMDAADVRKVMLEEPPKNLSADDPKVSAARAALIGGCEGQLGRLQLRPRSGAPRLDGRANRLAHISGRRGQRRASRLPRAGYVPRRPAGREKAVSLPKRSVSALSKAMVCGLSATSLPPRAPRRRPTRSMTLHAPNFGAFACAAGLKSRGY